MTRHELVCLLLKCPDNAEVIHVNGVNEAEERERGIKIIEIHRSANLVHTSYEEV